jgi:hypothetical protein
MSISKRDFWTSKPLICLAMRLTELALWDKIMKEKTLGDKI